MRKICPVAENFEGASWLPSKAKLNLPERPCISALLAAGQEGEPLHQPGEEDGPGWEGWDVQLLDD